MTAFLGIDIGTSGTKTLLVDPTGRILASAVSEYPVSNPHPGWSEQDPEDWWRATASSVQSALSQSRLPATDVAGIGLTGQMHGSVFLDADGRVLRPAILWNDQRTAEECDEITKTVGAECLIDLVSNPALTGFTAPKILWLRRHEPDLFRRCVSVLLPKDYVRFRLTGVKATEVSDASGTLLLDVRRRRWSSEMLAALDLDPSLLPECFESPEPSSAVSAEAARLTGLVSGTPVVGGGGDQAAGAVGNGIVRRGVISATLGTSGVVFAFADRPQTDALGRVHTFCHAVPGKWHVMGVMLAAGGSFQWFRNNLSQTEKALAAERGVDPYELLTELAAQAQPGCEGLMFLPYLTGERTPHRDPFARGGWVGLTARHTRADLVRSLLEGVTFGMRDSLEIIREMGVTVDQVRVSGGGARSAFWRQLQADIYGLPVHTINAAEGPAFGAALLAMVGTGTYESVAAACDAAIQVTGVTEPSGARAVYDEAYPVWQQLYPRLADCFRQQARLAGQA